LIAVAAATLCAWPRAALRHPHPLVDVRLMAQPSIAVCNLMALLVGLGMYAGLSLINRYAQAPESTGYGIAASPLVAGFVLAPLALGSLIATPVRTWAGDRYGAQRVLIGGALLEAVTLLALVVIHEHLYQLLIAVTLLGIGIGCSFAVMPALIMAVAPRARTGSATSLNQVLRMVGGALGSAISITVLELHTAPGAVESTERGYAVAFAIAGTMCASAALVGAVAGRFPQVAAARGAEDPPGVL
jgi:MFS family permease